MSTKKIQILNSTVKQAQNADTLDGMHADEFATPSDVEQTAKTYADEVGSRVTGSVDSDGNYVVMFNDNFEWTAE